MLILLNTFLGVVAEVHRRSRGGSAPHNLYFSHRLAILIDRPHRFDFDVDSDSMLRSCGGGETVSQIIPSYSEYVFTHSKAFHL